MPCFSKQTDMFKYTEMKNKAGVKGLKGAFLFPTCLYAKQS